MSGLADWCEDIRSALEDFRTVSALAGSPHEFCDADVEYLPAPHVPPRRLPEGKAAIYGFNFNGRWLKIGQVGPKSHARYVSQHYTGSASSTLSGSLERDESMRTVVGSSELADWIKRETNRVNILVPSDSGKYFRSLLEAFLHVRLHPKYEG